MKDTDNTKNTSKHSLGRRILEFIAFLVLYTLFFIGLELLWNKFITGNGFTFDPAQLPWIITSGIIIWTVFLAVELRRNKSGKTDEEDKTEK